MQTCPKCKRDNAAYHNDTSRPYKLPQALVHEFICADCEHEFAVVEITLEGPYTTEDTLALCLAKMFREEITQNKMLTIEVERLKQRLSKS